MIFLCINKHPKASKRYFNLQPRLSLSTTPTLSLLPGSLKKTQICKEKKTTNKKKKTQQSSKSNTTTNSVNHQIIASPNYHLQHHHCYYPPPKNTDLEAKSKKQGKRNREKRKHSTHVIEVAASSKTTLLSRLAEIEAMERVVARLARFEREIGSEHAISIFRVPLIL